MGSNSSNAVPKSDGIYWALDEPQNVAQKITEAFGAYQSSLKSRGVFNLWVKSYREYFGMDATGSEHETSMISFDGDQGELAYTRSNHFRSIIRQRVTMAIGTRPNFEPEPSSLSVDVLTQIPLARNIANFYAKKFEPAAQEALEFAACSFARAYVWAPWDRQSGAATDPIPQFTTEDETDAEGNLIPKGSPKEPVQGYEGDMVYRAKSPIDVMIARTSTPDDPPWVVIRDRENRYNLMAKYPEKADVIEGLDNARSEHDLGFLHDEADEDSDDVFIFYLYVAKSPAVPNGRYVTIIGGEAVDAGDLPYERIPVFRCAPTEMLGTDEGYAEAWDLVGTSRAYNAVVSNVLTISDNARVPMLAKPLGSHISHNAMMGGFNVVEFPGETEGPKILQPVRPGPDDLVLADKLRSDMELTSGINGAKRGDPASNVKSAKMASLMESMASQYNVGDQQAYVKLIQALATHTLQCLQKFAENDRLIPLSDSAQSITKFKSADIKLISAIGVKVMPTPLRSVDGRMALGEMAYQRGEMSLQELTEYVDSGKLPDKGANFVAQRKLALQENDALLRATRVEQAEAPPLPNPMTGAMMPGPPLQTTPEVPVLVTDDHVIHVQVHNVQLADPMIRSNPQALKVHMAHIDWHKRLAQATDPLLMMLLTAPQGVPLPPPAPPGGPGPQKQGEPGPKLGSENEEQNARNGRASREAKPPSMQKG